MTCSCTYHKSKMFLKEFCLLVFSSNGFNDSSQWSAVVLETETPELCGDTISLTAFIVKSKAVWGIRYCSLRVKRNVAAITCEWLVTMEVLLLPSAPLSSVGLRLFASLLSGSLWLLPSGSLWLLPSGSLWLLPSGSESLFSWLESPNKISLLELSSCSFHRGCLRLAWDKRELNVTNNRGHSFPGQHISNSLLPECDSFSNWYFVGQRNEQQGQQLELIFLAYWRERVIWILFIGLLNEHHGNIVDHA